MYRTPAQCGQRDAESTFKLWLFMAAVSHRPSVIQVLGKLIWDSIHTEMRVCRSRHTCAYLRSPIEKKGLWTPKRYEVSPNSFIMMLLLPMPRQENSIILNALNRISSSYSNFELPSVSLPYLLGYISRPRCPFCFFYCTCTLPLL